MPNPEPYLNDAGQVVIADPHVSQFGTDEPGGYEPAVAALPYRIGVQRGWHAIDSAAVRPGCDEHAWAACGAIVRVTKYDQPYDVTALPVALDPCHTCEWAVAARTGTLDQALARLTDPVAHGVAAGFLSAEALGEDDRDNPALIQLLAAVSDHAAVDLVSEECAEDGCEHEGGCPKSAACRACSMQAGSWAGEREGTYRGECRITAPCAVLLALAAAAAEAVKPA